MQEGSAHLGRRRWATLVILTLSTFIVTLDSAVVFIALPAILQDLGGTLDEATWVIAAFVLSFAVFLLPFGRLADIYGRRFLFMSGIVVFALASLGCALAPSMEFLIGARVVQGIGAAMVEPTVLAIIKATFPSERLGLAFGVQGIAAVLGAAFGPILGGIITTALSWEYIFLLNVPVGVVAVAGALLVVPESRAEGVSRRLDLPGLLFSGTSVFFLVFAIVEGERFGWGSVTILGSFVAAAVLLALFIITELRVRVPLVDLTLFKDRLFAVGNVLRGVVEFATLGLFFPLALFLQIQLGHSPLDTGLLLLPLIVASFFTSPLAGALSDRVDVRLIVVPGFVVVAVGIFWVAHLSPETGWKFFIAPLAIAGAGLGALEAPTVSATLRNVPTAQSGIASSVSYTTFLIGLELGVAVVGAVLQSQLVANVKDALSGANLPPGVAEEISSLSEGGVSGQPAAQISGPGAARIQGLIEGAFAAAVNTALFSCVAVALLGAVVALFFSSNRKVGVEFSASLAPPIGNANDGELSSRCR
jgi:EmrB/QacA subfamily drug resistance transporter